MDFVGAITDNPVSETLMLPVTNQIRYLIFCTKYVRNMRTKMGELNFARDDVEDHMNQNIRRRLEVPGLVRAWLEDVEKINTKVENFGDVGSCFLFITRHKLGRKAFKITEEIESATRKHNLIKWTDYPIPLGMVVSSKASTSMPSIDHHDDFESRKQTFTEALQALQPDNESHMIALCGMGGVGKTTMMQSLKKVVQQKKWFNYVAQAVIGEKTDPIVIQDAIADYIGVELNQKTKPARADQLRKWFMRKSEGGKSKFLVILDNVWEFVDLEDIGLSRLPNQGVSFKVLLTSRKRDVCTMMGVEPHSIFNVKELIETEAQSLFRQFAEVSDPELDQIGEDIVKKCRGLPMAIKTMALNLKTKSKDAWKSSLSSLEHHDLGEVVNKIFEMSYDNLEGEDTKSVFMLCGLFPEDFNIPTEELMRYGWGLKLFKRKDTISEARDRLNTCIELLKDSNLLIGSEDVRCVKMHDLVRDFVLDMFSKVEHASLISHGSKPEWPENDMSASCKRVSLTCKNMSKFPRDLKFPNLSILKLMHGDKSLRFPENFYEEMEQVHVISYDEMQYPLLPSSIHFSPNLRVLRLHRCSLMKFDCSCIGDLSNLEVLSFSKSRIDWLPSTIGKLEKLRLLDLTDCATLVVDKGVLQNLVKLEELYMGVDGRSGKAIRLTFENYKEIAQRSANLYALEIEFFENNIQLQNMSFENLHRFKISVGCSFSDEFCESGNSFENKLQLVTNKDEVMKSGTNQLFEKTNVLFLSVEDMDELGDVGVKSSFQNLRVLNFSKCAELRHLFTLGVAKTLSKLEKLEVYDCNNMEEVVHTEGNGEEAITFPKLKFLSLRGLPKLSGLCHRKIELPELLELDLYRIPGFTSIYSKNKLETSSLFKEEVVIPKLEKLHIDCMENLKEIWPREFGASEEIKLRAIKVMNCDNLVNLFPCNFMPLLHHLEELQVKWCGSVQVLFNIALDSVVEIGKESSLRSIKVNHCEKLASVTKKGNPMPLLYHLEELQVEKCNSMEMLFDVHLDSVGKIAEGGSSLRSIRVSKCDKLVNLFPSNPMPFIHHLEKIEVEDCGSIEVLFNVQLGETGEGSSSLRSIRVSKCDKLVNLFPSNPMPFIHHLEKIEVEDCGSIEVLFNVQLGETGEGSSSLRSIRVSKCDKLVNLFPSNPMPFIHHLEKIEVEDCGSIEVLFDIDLDLVGESGEGSSLRCIQVEDLAKLREVWRIKGAHDPRHPIRGFQAVKSIHIERCRRFRNVFTPITANFDLPALMHLLIRSTGENGRNDESAKSSQEQEEETEDALQVGDSMSNVVIPSCLLHSLRNLRGLVIMYIEGIEVVFEMESPRSRELATTHDDQQQILSNLEYLEIYGMESMSHVWKCNRNKYPILGKQPLESPFQNLKTIKMNGCKSIKYLFSPKMAKLLSNLKEIGILCCEGIEEVVSNRDDEDENIVSISTSTYTSCTTLFPRLDSLHLYDLPKLRCIGGGGNNKLSLNSSTITTPFKDSEAGGVSWSLCQYATDIRIDKCHALSSVIPRLNVLLKPPNLKKLEIWNCDLLEHVLPFSALENLNQLQELRVKDCKAMKVIVKEEDGEKISSSKEEVVVFPRLKTIELEDLPDLVGFFLGMNEFRWPSLDKVWIKNCPEMTLFTSGGLTAPQLKYIHTALGKYSVEERGLNSHLHATRHQTPSSSAQGRPWSFHDLIELHLENDANVEKIIPSNELLQLQNLEKIRVRWCSKVEEVFEAAGGNSSSSHESQTTTTTAANPVNLPNLREVDLCQLPCLRYIWKSNEWTAFQFPNLTTISIECCNSLTHVFSSSMVGSLLQLQQLNIQSCKHMEEVVEVVTDSNDGVEEEEEEESDAKTNQLIITFPRLKSLYLEELPSLKGFCLGKEDFSFPLLDTLRISLYPAITTFTKGNSTTPQLREIETNFGSFYGGEIDVNSFIKTKQEEFKKRLVKRN